MDATKKLELLGRVMRLESESVLQKLWAVIEESEEYPKDEIVGYTALGEPMNIAMYRARLEEGKKDYEEGRYTRHEDFLKEIDKW
jgi:uncharacterized protein (UPF0297 family)